MTPVLESAHMRLTATQKKRIATYLQKHPQIVAAYLFGSQATGKTGPLSDVDIGILMDASLAPSVREKLIIEIFHELALDLHTDHIDLIDMLTAPVLLQHRIVTRGKRLFAKDRILANKFTIRVIQTFEDFLPHLQTQTRFIKRKIATYVTN